jgi:hypothetical protein
MKNKLKNLFVPYELAYTAKQNGFNELCFGLFNPIKELCYPQLHYGEWKSFNDQEDQRWITPAPTYQQIVDWLSEKFNIDILLDITYDNKNGNWYYYKIFLNSKSKSYTEGDFSKICALKEAIKESFKLIKK